MGCNCGSKNIIKKRADLHRIQKELAIKLKKEMAKYKYQVLESVGENARLVFKKMRMSVKDMSQATLKMLYDSGHPQVEKIELSSGKKDK
mgnify:CR=1 FL=1|jgi:hypothetical protein|tara:strand:+ start:4667 stop:4936 length:270 start_codon:yes stop_codon:yes gene_type:complete